MFIDKHLGKSFESLSEHNNQPQFDNDENKDREGLEIIFQKVVRQTQFAKPCIATVIVIYFFWLLYKIGEIKLEIFVEYFGKKTCEVVLHIQNLKQFFQEIMAKHRLCRYIYVVVHQCYGKEIE